ncbi:energy transducer TonB [Henriciella sp.]|uniref:energy transducer TonB n=1 Tax=Henriciella sp. TaxID=1968823 RepID=UPI00263874ED|nr:energy transducer TonB [Henriciella sp.]
MKTTRKEKKSDTLEVRLPHSKKEAFKAACKSEGITASHAVRTFVDAYLRRSHRMQLKRIAKDLSMTLIKNPMKTTGGIAATGAAIATASIMALPSAADSQPQPIEPPVPEYPIELAEQGIGAKCKGTFDVSEKGYVEPGVQVDCTHPGFVDATRTAIQTLRFEPKMQDGKPIRRKGVVYPIQYIITPDTEEISGPDTD